MPIMWHMFKKETRKTLSYCLLGLSRIQKSYLTKELIVVASNSPFSFCSKFMEMKEDSGTGNGCFILVAKPCQTNRFENLQYQQRGIQINEFWINEDVLHHENTTLTDAACR